MDYFKKLQQLLLTEQEEDRNAYLKIATSSSAAERRTNGIAWYPVAIRDTEPGRGDYLTIELERTTHHDIIHQFRSGIPAALFSNHNPAEDRIEGIINFVSGNRLKLALREDELPEWTRNGKLGVDLLFDENSYQEMQKAMEQAEALLDNNTEGKLVQIVTGKKKPAFDAEYEFVDPERLNASQMEAVHKILSADDLAIVHGPPGRGKTTTLVQAIKALIKKDGKQILVVAPSNAAVDLLSEKLSEEGLNVIRAGNPARISEELMSLTLDQKTAADPRMKEVKKMKKQAQAFKDMAHKYKRHFGKAERDQRKALFDEAHKVMKEADRTEQYIMDGLLDGAQVITATLVGANHYSIRNRKYHTVVIDEAGQALEPACWIPVLKARKLIMAGDHHQLPPTIKSKDAGRNGLNDTLMSKCVNLFPEAVILLKEQYRMHRHIMGYSSFVFYGNNLEAHTSVADHLIFADDKPLTFIDTAGCGYEEKTEGTRISNEEEALFLFRHVTHLIYTVEQHYDRHNFPSVAIISPYREQVFLMQDMLAQHSELMKYKNSISVNTIDSFQGQERDIVYISMTRSNADGIVGFLSDTRRMNVAMTRARKKLIVIGDSATLSSFPFYADFIAYAEKLDSWQSAWEFIEN